MSNAELADRLESLAAAWGPRPAGKATILEAAAALRAYVQDDEAIALLRKALMTAERPDEAAMGFETDGFLADEIKAFFSRRGISPRSE